MADPANLALIRRFPQKHLRPSQREDPGNRGNCNVDVRHCRPLPAVAPIDQHTKSRQLWGGPRELLTPLVARRRCLRAASNLTSSTMARHAARSLVDRRKGSRHVRIASISGLCCAALGPRRPAGSAMNAFVWGEVALLVDRLAGAASLMPAPATEATPAVCRGQPKPNRLGANRPRNRSPRLRRWPANARPHHCGWNGRRCLSELENGEY